MPDVLMHLLAEEPERVAKRSSLQKAMEALKAAAQKISQQKVDMMQPPPFVPPVTKPTAPFSTEPLLNQSLPTQQLAPTRFAYQHECLLECHATAGPVSNWHAQTLSLFLQQHVAKQNLMAPAATGLPLPRSLRMNFNGN